MIWYGWRIIKFFKHMKPNMTIFATALILMLCLTGCSNARARNDDKKPLRTVTELSAKDFNEKVYDMSKAKSSYLGDKPAIIDFTATWCGPCQRIAPILEEIAAEYGDRIVVYKVDIDKERDLAKAFKISSIPAILYIPADDGEAIMTVGARDKGKFRTEIETFLLK